MKVFIENEAGSDQKNIYNEKTLEYLESFTVSRKYPFPYGFVLDTTSGDGDNVDVFVLTDQPLVSGQIVDCEPIGLMEQFEKSWEETKAEEVEEDHNVLAFLKGEEEVFVNEAVKTRLTEFVHHVFDNVRENKTQVGRFLAKKAALHYIEKCIDE